MKQNTAKIMEELQLCEDFKTFYDENQDYMIRESLAEQLNRLADESGKKKAEIIRKAEISEIYGYQIFSGARLPEREKLICLAIGMGLTLDKVQLLLRNGGYTPLYAKLPADSIIIYGICKKMTVMEINNMLFQYGCKTLR